MASNDLYRLAGVATWVALVALILSAIALALFFGGAGRFWGPVNDVFVVITVVSLIPAVLGIARRTDEQRPRWLSVLTAATVGGLLVIAVGQTLLVVGALSLGGSYISGGVGVIPFLFWIAAGAVLSLRLHILPVPLGWTALATLAAIAVASALSMVTMGPALWVATAALVVALSAWLVSLARSFG